MMARVVVYDEFRRKVLEEGGMTPGDAQRRRDAYRAIYRPEYGYSVDAYA